MAGASKSPTAVGHQRVPMTADREPAERFRCREVSRLLSGTNLSPDKERVVERLSRSLVGKLLCGPIAEAMAPTDIGKNLGTEGQTTSPGPLPRRHKSS